MMGDDSKTIASISKERQRKRQPSVTPTAIDIDASKSIGTMSGISATSTKTSIVRAKVHKEYSAKFEAQNSKINQLLEDKKEQEKQAIALQKRMEEMTKMLQALQSNKSERKSKKNADEMSQNSGEPSTSDESMASQEKIAERDEKALKKDRGK